WQREHAKGITEQPIGAPKYLVSQKIISDVTVGDGCVGHDGGFLVADAAYGCKLTTDAQGRAVCYTLLREPHQPPPELDYAEWKRRARALVTVPTTMDERHWRNLFIKGNTPEEAASYATTYYTNNTVRPKGRR